MNKNNNYSLRTQKTWLETRAEIANEMRLWGISDWIVEKFGEGARLSYVQNGRTVDLNMSKQSRAQDNLRVLFLAIQAIRLNELRGIADVVANAYLQLNAPVQIKNPYDVLGLPRGTASSVCEAQFKELAKQYHPDTPGGSVEKMQELTHAIEEIRKGV